MAWLRFRWAPGPEGGPPVVLGTDMAVLAEQGRLATMTGFFDSAPAG